MIRRFLVCLCLLAAFFVLSLPQDAGAVDAPISKKHGVELWSDAPGGHYRLHNTNAYPVSVTWKDDNGKHTTLVHGKEGIPWLELWRRMGVVKLVSVDEAKL